MSSVTRVRIAINGLRRGGASIRPLNVNATLRLDSARSSDELGEVDREAPARRHDQQRGRRRPGPARRRAARRGPSARSTAAICVTKRCTVSPSWNGETAGSGCRRDASGQPVPSSRVFHAAAAERDERDLGRHVEPSAGQDDDGCRSSRAVSLAYLSRVRVTDGVRHRSAARVAALDSPHPDAACPRTSRTPPRAGLRRRRCRAARRSSYPPTSSGPIRVRCFLCLVVA